jgi:hypothetical protein
MHLLSKYVYPIPWQERGRRKTGFRMKTNTNAGSILTFSSLSLDGRGVG